MVTATLPCLTDESEPDAEQQSAFFPGRNPRDSVALSVESEATITPETFTRSTSHDADADADAEADLARDKTSILAGYVGLFTGLGALVSLLVFLPLPTQFSKIEGVEIGEAVQYSYYVVGSISILVASFVYIGLRKLKGEEGKGFRTLFGLKKGNPDTPKRTFLPYRQLLRDAVILGATDSYIGLGYLGGFVARASTVAISAFIPLFVKIFFLTHVPSDDDKDRLANQRKAYVLASILTGVAQLCALLAAPVFGYLARRRGRFNYPIIATAVFGIIGYSAFPNLASPEVKNVDGRGGSPAVFLLVALIGISQIGAIVCSLGSLGKGVLATDAHRNGVVPFADTTAPLESDEAAPLLENGTIKPIPKTTRVLLKGTIAGVYSWCGGAAILLLTKLGGFLFDRWTHGAPFYLMAIFNGILLVTALGVDVVRLGRDRQGKRV